ncbi:proteinaceous RNase P 2-like [Salvia splendens]|uniref:proteinaceous RNase P 2-like n=1 Tax=Salvia splendens TaxID=180675 RepID=UPI001C253347|nr:proteinaceous RNase P 2-like [Salvia splendens]
MSNQNTRRKKQKQTPESQFRCTLDQCSKSKDLSAAITLYESSSSPTLTLNNLNSLLYICSEALSNSNTRQSAIDFGFKLFRNHNNENLKPNEATLTAVARLAAANGDYAFDLAKSVMKQCAAPKLRTFTPALNCFCGVGAADRAYEVEEHVVSAGPQMERALPAVNS